VKLCEFSPAFGIEGLIMEQFPLLPMDMPATDRPNPLDLLQAQDEGLLQRFLPIKYGRMLASPFAFLRGSAVVMAADLAHTPNSGLRTILCGDAHLSNFGLFASPERRLVFDLNDFDEAFPGPGNGMSSGCPPVRPLPDEKTVSVTKQIAAWLKRRCALTGGR
jgi:hypothetical protein